MCWEGGGQDLEFSAKDLWGINDSGRQAGRGIQAAESKRLLGCPMVAYRPMSFTLRWVLAAMSRRALAMFLVWK